MDVLKKLYETFILKERRGTGGLVFKYVPNEDVINRMNEVFMGNWSTRVTYKDTIDDQVILEVLVTVMDDDTKIAYTHTGFGSQQIMRYKDGPNAGKIIDIGNGFKGALAKAIVNACTRWGVGLYKESNPYEVEDTFETPTVPTQLPPVSTPTPMPTVQPPAPSTPVVPVNSTINTAIGPVSVPIEPVVAPSAIPSIPNVPSEITDSIVVKQSNEELDMPKIPIPNQNVRPAPMINVAPTTPDVPFLSQDNSAVKISDVQRVALNGILDMQKIKYEDLAAEAFEANGIDKQVPQKEALSYDDAVKIIKYGNDKFRKTR